MRFILTDIKIYIDSILKQLYNSASEKCLLQLLQKD